MFSEEADCCCREELAHIFIYNRKQAYALAKEYGHGSACVEKGWHSWWFNLPPALAHFYYEFLDRLFPQLIDPDLVTLEETAKRLHIETGTLESISRRA